MNNDRGDIVIILAALLALGFFALGMGEGIYKKNKDQSSPEYQSEQLRQINQKLEDKK
ncbi:MAG: hypothetical protein ABIL58_00665 [Pseudomonadota bacterium]